MLESFAEGAEEPGDVLQMFKGGPLAPRGGAWQETGRSRFKSRGRDGGGIRSRGQALNLRDRAGQGRGRAAR